MARRRLLVPAAVFVATGCQSDYAGQTLPSPYYLTDDVQYYAPGPGFKLAREAAAMQEQKAAEISEAQDAASNGRRPSDAATIVARVVSLSHSFRFVPLVPPNSGDTAHQHPITVSVSTSHNRVHAGRRIAPIARSRLSGENGGTAPCVAGASRIANRGLRALRPRGNSSLRGFRRSRVRRSEKLRRRSSSRRFAPVRIGRRNRCVAHRESRTACDRHERERRVGHPIARFRIASAAAA